MKEKLLSHSPDDDDKIILQKSLIKAFCNIFILRFYLFCPTSFHISHQI